MMDNGKRYYIVDTEGHYYKINEKGSLVVASSTEDATTFSLRDANLRIGTGRKARFYNVLEAYEIEQQVEEVIDEEPVYDAPDYDTVDKPTMFDSLHNNWEDMLSNLCYMSDHMDEYQSNLNDMLSDVDKEICDIMHYLEFNELNDSDMIKASKMLQERRRHRREIKDEMEKTALMKSTFLDSAFKIKVQQSLEFMEKMKTRQYTPRKLNELFQTQIFQATA